MSDPTVRGWVTIVLVTSPRGRDDADDPTRAGHAGAGRARAGRREPEPPAGSDVPPLPAEGMALASRPGSVFAGPAGHPVHPIVGAVAIGAFVGSVGLDLGSFVADPAWAYAKAAYVLGGFGVVVGVLAALSGLTDLVRVPRGTIAFRTGIRHLLLMDATLAAFAVSFVLRRGSDFAVSDSPDGVAVALSVLGFVTLAVGAWTGLRLTYTHGVRVRAGDHRLEGFGTAEG